MTGFEPKIVGFLCNWCSYTGADLAGTSRIKYASNLRVIRTMCSARIDPTFILKALMEGADGVLICGCHPGDCHYVEGNYKAMRRYPLLKKLLDSYGIENERVQLEWVSASEGKREVPVNVEVRAFTMPEEWNGQDVFLAFEGVTFPTAAMNGPALGWSSMLPLSNSCCSTFRGWACAAATRPWCGRAPRRR